MNLKNYLAEKLATVFIAHEYIVTPDSLKYIISCLEKRITIENLSKEQIDKFIDHVEMGFYGILFKQPTCIASMFHRHFEKLGKDGKQKMVY